MNTGAFSLANFTDPVTRVVTPNVLTPVAVFGTPSSSGVNGNYAYQVRQFQFGARVIF